MICADATNTDACRSIFDGKRRPEAKSLCFVAPSFADYQKYFHFSAEAAKLADAFWPPAAYFTASCGPRQGRRIAMSHQP